MTQEYKKYKDELEAANIMLKAKAFSFYAKCREEDNGGNIYTFSASTGKAADEQGDVMRSPIYRTGDILIVNAEEAYRHTGDNFVPMKDYCAQASVVIDLLNQGERYETAMEEWGAHTPPTQTTTPSESKAYPINV